MKIKEKLIFLIILSNLLSCKKEEIKKIDKQVNKDSTIVAVPQINYFTPKSGVTGDYVKFYGKNVSLNNLKVIFGDSPGTIKEADSISIIAEVPKYIQPGYCKIQIASNNKQIPVKDSFFLFGPIIKSFSPKSGKGTVSLSIQGENFSLITWRNRVTIGYQIAEITKATTQQLEVNISLNNLPATGFPIKITVDNITYTTKEEFNIQSPWTQLVSLPVSAIAGGVTFGLNNKIYYCTGRTSWLIANSFTKYVLEYDISTGTWARKKDFPGTARDKAVCFTLNEEAYVGLGITNDADGTYENDFWKYNQTNDSWTRIGSFPGEPRSGAVAFSCNGKGYVIMGRGNYSYRDSWVYTPETDKWDSLPSFPSNGLSNAHLAIKDSKFYLFYKTDGQNNGVWQFDLTANTWKYIGVFETFPIVSFYDNNRCYFLSTDRNFYKFIPEENKIISKPYFPGEERSWYAEIGVQIIIGNKLYFGAGSVGGYGKCTNDF